MKQEIKEIIEKIKKGEVPKGFKKTEFGVFPSDWCTDKTFRDLFEFYGGLGKSRDELSNNGIEYLHYGDLHRNDRNIVTYEEYSMLPKFSINLKGDETFLMEDGDIAFLDASEDLEGTSRAVLIDNPDNKPFIAGLHIIFAKSKRDFLSKYFRQYITIPSYVKKQFYCLSCGFKVYGINRNSLTKIKYVYPVNREEQERIAEILMKWDKAIELQESLIENISQKRTGILGSIFSKKDMLCSIKIGEFVTEKSKRNHIGNNNIKSISNKYGFINQSSQFDKLVARQNLDNYKIVEHMDVAYNPSRINVGSIAIYDDKEIAIVSPMYIVFSCNKISPALLLLALETPKGKYKIESYLTGSVRNSLSFSDLCKINIDIPKEEYRSKVIDLFAEIDRTILLEQKKLEKLKQQRKALQQYLLNGIVRVKI